MSGFDKRIDAYIEKSAEFSRPILEHLRKLIHKTCPEVEETLKWSTPSFEYKGMFCGFAAFKAHVKFMFWKQAILIEDEKNKAMIEALDRINSLKDLPKDEDIVALIHHAMELNEKNIKPQKMAPTAKKEITVPEDLAKALSKNKKAQTAFDKFSYSHRKEYIEWINEAKTDPTRLKRIATTVEWVSEGKGRNWKYERPKEK
jgi:hypothetical protein